MPVGGVQPTLRHLEMLSVLRQGTVPCLPTTMLSAEVPPVDPSSPQAQTTPLPDGASTSSDFKLPVDVLFLSSLTTDRPDSLYATLVTAVNEPPLGLVYSSPLSISLSITTAQATYYSRSRNSLWVKGATSGATQNVVAIRRDCDGDALEFIVGQKPGTGFCHTLRATSCFGPTSGLTHLEATLRKRKVEAPTGSYTKRLFEDESMLEAKLREETDEVCRAKGWDETRLEAADLLYFLMVCASLSGYQPTYLPTLLGPMYSQQCLTQRCTRRTRLAGRQSHPPTRKRQACLRQRL